MYCRSTQPAELLPVRLDDHSGCWGPRDVKTAREPFDMLNMFDTDDMLAKMATDKMLVINMILGYEEAVMGRSDKELLSVLTGGLRGLVSGGRVGSWITGVELLQLVRRGVVQGGIFW